jgi:hypothetical protein
MDEYNYVYESSIDDFSERCAALRTSWFAYPLMTQYLDQFICLKFSIEQSWSGNGQKWRTQDSFVYVIAKLTG